MKINTNKVFTLFLLLFIQTTLLYAQDIDKTISVKLKQATFKAFRENIERKTGYSFIYGNDIKLKYPINIDKQNIKIENLLRDVFEKEDISFKIINNHIILKKEKTKKKKDLKIYGYILDKDSKESLIGANVLVKDDGTGSITNPFGYYCISLSQGEHELDFSYVGYETKKISVSFLKDTLINIQLKNSTQLNEVVVTSDNAETGINSTRMGASSINLKQINNTPSLLGEPDVLKSIQMMPGVNNGQNGTSGLIVRGGGPEQNLYLLDGIPIYNVDHVLGFVSVFTPEAVKKVELYKGSYPSRYGGRLSSIVDIRTNDGDMQKYHGGLTVGLLTAKINFQGPIIKNKTSFLFSARRSYIDFCIQPFLEDDEKMKLYIYDINAKVNHKINDCNRLFFSLYNGCDMYSYKYNDNYNNNEEVDKEKYSWGNTIGNIRWNHVFNGNLFGNLTLFYNNFHSRINDNYRYSQDYINSKYKSGIKDFGLLTDFDFHLNSFNFIKYGFNYTYHTFCPDIKNYVASYNNYDNQNLKYDRQIGSPIVYSNELSLYVEDDIRLNESLRCNAGVHLSTFQVHDKIYKSVEPRISLSYKVNKNILLKSSFTEMSQFINLLSSSSIMLPTDLWVPVTSSIRPMKALQYSLGTYYVGIKGWELSIEGYYKSLKNVLEYKDGSSYIGNSVNWEEKVEMGKGRNYGMEFMIEKCVGKTTGNISYTLSKADRKFSADGINNGKWFPYKYDRRHSIKISLNHQLTPKIDFNATWTYASGIMASIPMDKSVAIIPEGVKIGGEYYNSYNSEGINLQEIKNISSRNNYRLPSSHQLNIGMNFHKKTKHGERIWNITILNVYNSMNPDHVYAKEKTMSDNTEILYLKKKTFIPFLPSFSYTFKF